MFDGVFQETYFVTPEDYQPLAKVRKSIKRDLLAGVCSALRESARAGAQLIVGDGQGAIIAAALARPRIVEAALIARSTQADEGSMFSAAWHAIRVIVCNAPKLYGSARVERLFEALPTAGGASAARRGIPPDVVVKPLAGPSQFAAAFAAKLSLLQVEHVGEVLMPALLSKLSFRFGQQSTGTCACGRRALILARCAQCAKEDLQEQEENLAEDTELCPDIAEVGLQTTSSWLGGAAFLVEPSFIASTLKSETKSSSITTLNGLLITRQPAVRGGSGSGELTVLPRPPLTCPFRMLLLHRDGALALVQRCVDPLHETVGAIDFRPFGGVGSELVMIASGRWMYYDDRSQAVPLLAATHHHRHCRGKVRVGPHLQSVSSISSGYTAEFSALLARVWKEAVEERRKSAVPRSASEAILAPPGGTLLEQRTRTAFQPVLPQIAAIEVDAEDVAKGRESERIAITNREQLADTIRGSEPVPGCKPFAVTLALRTAVLEAQRLDPALAPKIQDADEARGPGCERQWENCRLG